MDLKSFDELSSLEIDTLREIGSIGTGNAATAMSQLLEREVRITLPEVRIMGYNEAIEWMGGPERPESALMKVEIIILPVSTRVDWPSSSRSV